MSGLVATPAGDADFDGAEELLDRLDLPDAALANLARLVAAGEAPFSDGGGDGWAARVEVDGTALLVRGDTARWAIYLPAGADDADAMHAARKLHGLLGEQGDGWDLDR
ncbi:MAG TPA: hypothetical protein VMZ28_16815 [Kofleriaceae bacterium]|nr:hypothetical protein [Kofleriaceae bacterium]